MFGVGRSCRLCSLHPPHTKERSQETELVTWRKSLWGARVHGISNIPLKKETESSLELPLQRLISLVLCVVLKLGIYSDLFHTFVSQKYLASPSYPLERHQTQPESRNKRHGGELDIVHCVLNPSDLLKHFL